MSTDSAADAPDPQWFSWASPVGLGIGLVCVGGFFVLIAVGLSVLAAIS